VGEASVKLAVIGTGVRTPLLLHGLASGASGLPVDEVVLHDTDGERLEVMAALGAHLSEGWGSGLKLRAETDPAGALSGADFVFAAIRVGQERARALDERIPLAHGVLGQETTGPGGFAMALRTIPAMLKYAALIERVAPGALLVNFTNPVGIILQAITAQSSVRAVGVCDTPTGMRRAVARLLGVPGNALHVDYVGLNHLGWMRRILVDGRDRTSEVIHRYEELRALGHGWELFDADLVRTLGLLPNEYLYFYYHRDRAVESILASGGTRGEQLAELNSALWTALRDAIGRGDPEAAEAAWTRATRTRRGTYLARERGDPAVEPAAALDQSVFEGEGYEGLAVAVMTAVGRRIPAPLILNVPNRGAIAGMSHDDVVEVTCMADGNGAHPLSQGEVPAEAWALLAPVKEYERLTVDAALTGSYRTALRALAVHPLVGSFDVAKAILDDYLAAHAEHLGYLGA
jgi:6-phospho-beta-glucosidase